MGGIAGNAIQNAVGVWHLENLPRWKEIYLHVHSCVG